MTLSEELLYRDFVNQYTFSNLSELDKEPITFYWGVDPSGSSMTVGHLAPAMMVRQFIEHGHKAVLLIGGATGMIGDPDGKKQERDLLTIEQIEENKRNIVKQYERVFAGQPFEVVDNYDWFKDMGYLNFLREIGKKVPMSQLLDREFIKSRIGEDTGGISYAEFSYNLIQGYDFLHLFRDKGVTLQVAGADQWGNSITGIQLIKRLEGKDAHVFTTPLIINKATGIKFGKTESGAVWLDPILTTPYQFYQFWLNMDDEFAKDLIKKYTMLDKDTIEAVIAEHDKAPQKRILQRRLADESVRIVHGDERLNTVHLMLSVLFEDGNPDELLNGNIDDLAAEIPVVESGISIIDALTISSIAESKGAARRLVAGGGVRLNGEKINDDSQILSSKNLAKVGKNKFVLVR
jgi:tyrosyl-tRNA synthetase